MNALASRVSTSDPVGVDVLPFRNPPYLGIEWDAENRLIAINQGSERSEFTYDGLKRRVRMVEKVGGVVQSDRRVLWCERTICEERDSSGTTVVRRAFALGEQIAGAAQFFAKDHLGSVTEVANSGGALLARYTFDPWGRRTLATGTDVTTVGFTGHRWQENGEISLALHRVYDAHSGNWLSQDPIGLAGGLNFYTYTFGNPVRFVDRLGLEITCSWGARYVYNVPRTNCDPLEGCTTPRFQRDIGECEEECGKWKFDGWIRVTFVIEFSVSPDLPAEDAPGFPPGITLWEHEQIHKWDFVDWCGGFKNYPSEGFSSPAECNQARENLINSIDSTFFQPRPHDHN
jgi:RHS repeat-associated protein